MPPELQQYCEAARVQKPIEKNAKREWTLWDLGIKLDSGLARAGLGDLPAVAIFSSLNSLLETAGGGSATRCNK